MDSEEQVCDEEAAVAPEPVNEDEKKKWCCTRILEARQRNAGCSEIFAILMQSCLGLTVTIIEILIGIVYLILGIVNLNDCPIQKSIPIIVIVFGVLFIINGITLKLVEWKYCNIRDRRDGLGTCALIILLVSLVAIQGLFIYGIIAFSSIEKMVVTDKKEQKSDKYCDRYLFSLTGILLLIGCFVCPIGILYIIIDCRSPPTQSSTGEDNTIRSPKPGKHHKTRT